MAYVLYVVKSEWRSFACVLDRLRWKGLIKPMKKTTNHHHHRHEQQQQQHVHIQLTFT